MDNASMKVAQAMIDAARENGYFVEGEPLRSAPELAEMEKTVFVNIEKQSGRSFAGQCRRSGGEDARLSSSL